METNNQKKPRAKISMQTRIVNLTDKVVSLTDKLAAVGRAKNGVEDERDKFARAVEDVNNIAVDKIRKLEDELDKAKHVRNVEHRKRNKAEAERDKYKAVLEKNKADSYPGLAVKERTLLNRIYKTSTAALTPKPEWLKALTPELEEYKKALEDLYNEQNGPPLIRREKHWQAAYDKAGELLTPEPEPKKPIIPCPDCPKDGTLKEIWSHPDEDHWDNE